MRIILFSFCLSISLASFSQGTFQKIYGNFIWGESARYLELCSDGGYIFSSWNDLSGIHVFKTDSVGTIEWIYEFPYACEGFNLIESYDHNFILAGFRNENSGFRLSPCILKLSSSGNLMWSKGFNFADSLTVSNSTTVVAQSNDSGYMLMSSLPLYGFGNYVIVVTKMDSLGNQIWSRNYGTGSEYGNTIIKVKPSGYIIMGYTDNLGPRKKFILKIDESGAILWSRLIGTDNPFPFGEPIQQTSDSGYIFFGERTGINNKIISKTNSSGDEVWSKLFSSSLDMSMSSLLQTEDGGIAISGNLQDSNSINPFIIKLDSIGNTEWTKLYNDSVGCVSGALTLKQANDRGYVFSGARQCTDGYLMLVKTDSLGNLSCPNSAIPGFQSVSINNPDSNISLSEQLRWFSDSSVSSPDQSFSHSEYSFCFISMNMSVLDEANESFSLVPNPFHSFATLKIENILTEFKNCELKIYNTVGSLVRTEAIENIQSHILNRNGMHDGIYFYQLIQVENTSEEILGSGKFIVE
jgi:hypothetical protein